MKDPRVVAVMLLLFTGCGAPAPAGTTGSPPAPAAPPKRIEASLRGNLQSLYPGVVGAVAGGNADAIQPLVGAGLTVTDDRGVLRPRIAEEAPTLDNGLWKALPDGRMETSWRIKEPAVWQDGTPVTTDDLLFTLTVHRDKELPFSGNRAFGFLESVDAPDTRSITVRWARAYIHADQLFSYALAPPLPKHLVEPFYREKKETFLENPFWTVEYVGAGPYQVVDFQPGASLLLKANARYILGRPQIDEINLRMFTDLNVVISNILAGAIDVSLGTSLSEDQAKNIRENWKDGSVSFIFDSWVRITPQLMSPSPAVVANARFRRALLQAIDRQTMVDTLMYGQGGVADNFVTPTEPEYPPVRDKAVTYPYDPARASQQLEEIGHRRGPDGVMRDAQGQQLDLEFRGSSASDITIKSLAAVSNDWQRLGVSINSVPIPPQQVADAAYRATYPAFEIVRYPTSADRLSELYSSQARTSENHYIGSNYPNYVDPAFDAMLDRYFLTIPQEARYQALGEIIHFVSDQLIVMGVFYQGPGSVVSNRLEGVTPQSRAWNAHEWRWK